MPAPSDPPLTDPEQATQAQAAMIDPATAVVTADLFKALADPTRVRLISALLDTELCVNDITILLGMEQSAVSHQLRTLRDWRLVKRERRGRLMYYSLDDEHVRDLLRMSLEHVRHG
ncbi:ArsR/SmtB family transcription factor [Chloroflexota bacterium]